ncbi:MAG: sugar transferase [Eubacteriales bacterium]|jgi:undecaprenyl phosphate N,N'-diacetylbacillosamine 1-phosphate transferase
MYRKFIKRLLDFTLSLVAIVVLLPLLIILSIAVLIGMGSPIIFSQERIGRGEKPFRFYKYRSMTNARDADGNLLDETKRLTRFGSFLRSTSLDELPELFLILTGKMSIIGPRPLPTYYMPYYREEERVRHTVRGGLIPADTISGKPIITWDEQLKWDAYYAKHCSFLLDIKIFIVTFKVLFLRAKEDYGSADRPHFNEERSGVTQ